MDLLEKLKDITERTILQKEYGILAKSGSRTFRFVSNGKNILKV